MPLSLPFVCFQAEGTLREIQNDLDFSPWSVTKAVLLNIGKTT